MKSYMKVTNPNEIEFTLSVTMNLGDWKELKRLLGSGYPAWKLGSAINDMIDQADKVFSPDEVEVKS